jgi:hypothetical protein
MPEGTLQERVERLIGILSAVAAEEQSLVEQLRRVRLAQTEVDGAPDVPVRAFSSNYSVEVAQSFEEHPLVESSLQQSPVTARDGPRTANSSGPSSAQPAWSTSSHNPPANEEEWPTPDRDLESASASGKRDYDYFTDLDEKLARLQFLGSDGPSTNRSL